ncbi:MAG: LemA family protein [Myxococcota bacterium]
MGWILLAALAALVVWGISLYNRLVALRNGGESAWSDIDVQLKRRWELIPNLVETVKGYAKHEQSTFEKVTAARTPGEHAAAEASLQGTLKSLFAVAEAYPELRANENFLGLQRDLSGLEEAIQNARRYYNAVVRDLNTAIESFPGNLLAGPFGFTKREYFELDSEAERSAPKVSFS